MKGSTVDRDLLQEKIYLKKSVGEIFNYNFATQNDESWSPPEYLKQYIEKVKEITESRSIDVEHNGEGTLFLRRRIRRRHIQ